MKTLNLKFIPLQILVASSLSISALAQESSSLPKESQTLIEKLSKWEAELNRKHIGEIQQKREQVAALLDEHKTAATKKGNLEQALLLRELTDTFRKPVVLNDEIEVTLAAPVVKNEIPKGLHCESVGLQAGTVGFRVELDSTVIFEKNGPRGFHGVGIENGKVVASEVFEMGYDAEATEKLDKFIRSLPEGATFVGGVVDTAEGDISKAMRRLGGVESGSIGRRQSYLVVGVKGGEDSSAIEVGPFEKDKAIFRNRLDSTADKKVAKN